ncbi:unnamed protein product [Strongylus vulgaris]|uniref:Uncharacterized protein n=1 Tax=Strongylus vulgaris TaxID=40348 RepID=A0A3P7ILP9_STRVU|nr:unnamed protein product [Strongylus vulgaris]
MPLLEGAPRSLSRVPRRRKYSSYIKLDPWPTEVSSKTTDPDAISSSAILSAKISTLPLSDYHESEMSKTPTESSLRKEADLFANFNAKVGKNLSEERPPTAVGSRGCTPSG